MNRTRKFAVLCLLAGASVYYLVRIKGTVPVFAKQSHVEVPVYSGEPVRKLKPELKNEKESIIRTLVVRGHHPENIVNNSDGSFHSKIGIENGKQKVYDEVTKPPRHLRRQLTKHFQQRLPKVLGIGVKKCGTTALARFLSLHPDIILPKPPELHFFDIEARYMRGINYYRKLMPFTADHEITMEKTPRYFVLPKVAARVKYMDPTTKLLLVICDPLKRAYSDFNFEANRNKNITKIKPGKPPPKSFDEFVKTALTEIKRKKSLLTFRNTTYEEFVLNSWSPSVYQHYLSILHTGLYSVYLKEWTKYFPLDQIHVINGDDLLTDPLKVINETEDFIGISREVGKENLFFDENKGFYCVRYPKDNDVRCLSKAKGTTRNRTLEEMVKPETIEMLRTYYEPYNNAIFEMLGKKLNWT